MPTFVRSAMNPNGTWQQDGMDHAELANRQFGAQQSAQALQAQLAMQELAQRGGQFSASLADRQAERAQGRQDQMNQFAAAADLTKSGWQHEDARHSSDLEQAMAIARLQKEPNAVEAARLASDKAWDDKIMGMLPGGVGGPAAARTQFATPPDMMGFGGAPKAAQAQGPAGPGAAMPSAPANGVMDKAAMRQLQTIMALRNRQALPDFETADMNHELVQMNLDDKKRSIGMNRIQQALDAGDVSTAQKLSAETGAQMPRVDAASVASRPEIAIKVQALADLVDSATGTGGDDADMRRLRDGVGDLINTLASHGVPMDEAKAVVAQNILPKIHARYGRLGGAVAAPFTANKVNAVHDLIGY